MSLVYTPLYDENGNIIDPTVFTQGAGVFAGVLNSEMDRDNLPINTIDAGELSGDIFTMSPANLAFNTEDDWLPDMDVTGWQNGTGTTTGSTNLGILSWTAEQDAHYDVHWSGSWFWDGAYSWATAGSRPDRTDTFDTIRLRITIDGINIGMAGPFEDGADYASTYMIGAIQLPAGAHTLKIECQVVRRIAQNGEEDGICTNNVTFTDRTVMVIGRMR